VRFAEASFYYRRRAKDDAPVIKAIRGYIDVNPRLGFDKVYESFRSVGSHGERRCSGTSTRSSGSTCRAGVKSRLPDRIKAPLAVPATPNEVWSADFVVESLWSGHSFRTFNVIDDFNRDGLRVEIDIRLSGSRIVRATEELAEMRGAPRRLRLEIGPEFISQALSKWAERRGVQLQFIQPGKPTQNGYIERSIMTFRTEVLSCYVFISLNEVGDVTVDWLQR
jgi:putative transposase